MTEFVIDAQGNLTVEGVHGEALRLLEDMTGSTHESVNCAVPLPRQKLDIPRWTGLPSAPHMEVASIWDGDVTSGPGSRFVIQMQGCPIRCPGCYVPQTHSRTGGTSASISRMAEMAVSSPCDGITILGGEPFFQSVELLQLLRAIGGRKHITLYTGFTYEHLEAIFGEVGWRILTYVDVLIEGPFDRTMMAGAGSWRGSSNQRILYFLTDRNKRLGAAYATQPAHTR